MNGPSTAAAPVFADAARLVIRRLWLRKSLAWLMHSLPVGAGFLALLLVLRFLGTSWSTGWLALGAIALWLALCLALAWWRKPEPYGALAFWDQRTLRADAFANAWWFERQAQPNAGQQLHLRFQSRALPTALNSLRKDIPLPDIRWWLIVPLLALVFFFVPGGAGYGLFDPVLTTEGKKLAAEEGKRLSEKKLDADKMKSLTEEEKKEIEKLQQKVQETAKALEQKDTKTAREVLSELERRAHDAEQLAEKLGTGESAWASEQMVAELRKHADTAELGDAVANKSTESTAKEAQKISDHLKDPQLTSETRDRMTETLKDVEKQAQPGDEQRVVGSHVINSSKDMTQKLTKDASKEFQDLADKMRALAQRDKAREELEKLAQQLRDSGANIAGQGTQGMQQLAGNQGQQSGNSQNSMQQMQSMPNAPQMQSMQIPGLSNMQPGQGQQGQGQQGMAQNMQMMTPVPGSGQQQGSKMLVPGKGNGNNGGKNGQPFLIAPIPGMQPGQQSPAMMLGGVASAGGLKAGNGTTALGNNPTEKTKPTQSGVVNAASNAEGESSVRSVEGAAHTENAARNAQATALQSIAAEENALDESALPTARREQVRRYFTELRKRFEKQN
jgi:biotin operon repressor